MIRDPLAGSDVVAELFDGRKTASRRGDTVGASAVTAAYAESVPSFRVTMTIGALAPGVAPTQIVPAAADAAAELTMVEASDVAVASGAARVTVRFTADDAELAQQIAQHTADATSLLAHVLHWRLTERVGGGWYPR